MVAFLGGCEFRGGEARRDPETVAPAPPVDVGTAFPSDFEVHVQSPQGLVRVQTARPSPGPEYERLAHEALEAYTRGDYETAIARAGEATAIDPNYLPAASTGALAACKLHREADANRFARGLTGISRDATGDVCMRSGVRLEGWQPMAPQP